MSICHVNVHSQMLQSITLPKLQQTPAPCTDCKAFEVNASDPETNTTPKSKSRHAHALQQQGSPATFLGVELPVRKGGVPKAAEEDVHAKANFLHEGDEDKF